MSKPAPSPIGRDRPGTSVVRLAACGDVHFTTRTPAGRDEHYAADVLNTIHDAKEIARVHHADAMLWVGDLFHSKGHTTHEEVATLAAAMRDQDNLAIPGNHDMQGNNLHNATTEQPYAVLASSGVLRDLSNTAATFSSFEVLVVGIPFGDEPDGGNLVYDRVFKATKQCTGKFSALVILSHDEMTPDGSLGHSGVNLVRRLMQQYQCPVVLINGHLHVDPVAVPVTEGTLGGWFVNIGTMARTALSDSDQAAVAIVDYDIARPRAVALSVQLVPLHVKPRDQAFPPRAAFAHTSSAGLDDFVAALSVQNEQHTDPAEFVRRVAAARGTAAPVLERSLQMVSEAR